MEIQQIRENIKPPCDVIDIHMHPWWSHGHLYSSTFKKCAEVHLHAADIAGITKMVVFDVEDDDNKNPSPQRLIDINDNLMKIVEFAPERFIPFAYLNPAYPYESLKELDRCLEFGMKGIKLWCGRRAGNAGTLIIAKRAAELGLPIIQHCAEKPFGNLQGESYPEDAAELAEVCPEVNLILAHLTNIGLRGIEEIKNYPNISIDISGGDPLFGFTRIAIDKLGADRIFFGTDVSVRGYGSQLSKVLNAELTLEEKEKILHLNAKRVIPGLEV
ncbi:MAG: amidohydrolase [Lentisphaerae bacterium]|nr:amidohydrolase [Lentisphaerota bacterium]MCP4101258.1 amidohydrolase [Lentisphaerota bacterium]